MNDKKLSLDALFEFVRQLETPEQREAFLTAACGEDESLRAELQQLLASHDEAGSFLEHGIRGVDITRAPEHLPSRANQAHPSSASATSVFHSIEQSAGCMPRVTLRDLEEDGPILRLQSPELPSGGVFANRYRLDGEIARGGMGAILKGRDLDLGRDLALKVLLDEHKEKPDVVQRFVEEAQIGGQLQHPGIAPVYELGQFQDERPFFSMKLVKGRTLAALLSDRSTPADDQPKYLAIFEQICQTMAYAHSRGVIHRDLKPSNIMVGSFGEVQVMDWGLAKVLPQGGVADEEKAYTKQSEKSVIQTLRSVGSDTPAGFGSQTKMGSVMGTPAYMSPEQAMGEVDRLDERADVFGLGAILCEILTGKPPYVDEDGIEVYRMASRGKLGACERRLAQSGMDADIVHLARKCLAADRDDRPRDARVVADAVSEFLESVQERLRAAELAKVEAQTRSIEERRRRRLQVGLATATLIVFVLVGGGVFWAWQVRRSREAGLQQSLARIGTLESRAEANPLELSSWREALAAAEQALEVHRELGDHAGVEVLLLEQQQLAEATAVAERHTKLLDTLIEIRAGKSDDNSGQRTNRAYARAFAEGGIDIHQLTVEDSARRIQRRGPEMTVTLSSALDDWSAWLRTRLFDDDQADRLMAIATLADPDPWRNQLREALAIRDIKSRLVALRPLYDSVELEDIPAVSLDLLGNALAQSGDTDSAEKILFEGYQMYPQDVWLAHDLATVLDKLGRLDESIRFYSASRALQPKTAHELGHVLIRAGRTDEGLSVFRALARDYPNDERHLACLGRELKAVDDHEAGTVLRRAVKLARQAVEAAPDEGNPYINLSNALWALDEYESAINTLQQSIDRMPENPLSHSNLAQFYLELNRFPEAEEAARKAVQLDPFTVAHQLKLIQALRASGKLTEAAECARQIIRRHPLSPDGYLALGRCLNLLGELEAAEATYQTALQLATVSANIHYEYSLFFSCQDRFEEAESIIRQGLELDPGHAGCHLELGNLLSRHPEKRDAAIAAYQEAIRLSPTLAFVHNQLGAAYLEAGRLEEAETVFRKAIEINPKEELAYRNLIKVTTRLNRPQDGLKAIRQAVQKYPQSYIVHLNYAEALLTTGRAEEVGDVVERAQQLTGSIVNPTHYAWSMAIQGEASLALGKSREAIERFRQGLDRRPDDQRLMSGLCNALVSVHDFQEALTLLENAEAKHPDNASYFSMHGHILMAQGSFPEAKTALEQAIALNPDDPIAHQNLGSVLSCQGKLEEAIICYERAAERFDYPVHAYSAIAQIYGRLGKSTEAEKAYEKAVAAGRAAVEQEPENAEHWFTLGAVLRSQGSYDEALLMVRKSTEIAPRNLQYLTQLGGDLSNRGDFAEAITVLSRALEIEPTNLLALRYLYITYTKQGQHEEARKALKRSLEIRETPDGYLTLGWDLFKQEKHSEALDALSKAVQLEPLNYERMANAAYLCRQYGETKAAIDYFKQAATLNPHDPHLQVNLAGVLLHVGRFDESLSHLRRGHELGKHQPNWPTEYISKWIRRMDDVIAAARRFSEFLEGEIAPKTVEEYFAFGVVCEANELFVQAASLFQDAIAVHEVGNSLAVDFHLHVATNGANAGAGLGDGNELSANARAELRRRAVESLRHVCDIQKKRLSAGDALFDMDIPISQWMTVHELSRLRDDRYVKELPSEEQDVLRALWQEVQTVAEQANPMQ